MPQLRRAQPQLFEKEVPAVPVQVQLPLTVQEQLRQVLQQWMQVLAQKIHEEVGHEQ